MEQVEYKAGSRISHYKGKTSFYPITSKFIGGQWYESYINNPRPTRREALKIARKVCKINALRPSHLPGTMKRKVNDKINFYPIIKFESFGNSIKDTINEPKPTRSKALTIAKKYIKRIIADKN